MDEQEVLLRTVMRRQAAVSIRVACVFIALLIVLPLVNLFLPQMAETDVFGFTATWLCLGVLFYPLTWVLSGYFVRRSDQIETDLLSSAGPKTLAALESDEEGARA